MIIRLERPADLSAIRALIAASFAVHPHSDRTEHHIVDRLRADGALTLSLVAVQDELIVGHVAFSPVHIADGSHGSHGWYGLGPLAVLSGYRRRGIGAALVVRGLDLLRQLDAAGCVVLGEPNYYARFGFHPDSALLLPGVPPTSFMALRFQARTARGVVAYHPAFGATG